MFRKTLSIRWSDLDPNMHVRHSIYYDFGAQARTEILQKLGLGMQFMKEHQIGPVLFKEECTFRRELHFGDQVAMDTHLLGLTKDGSKYQIEHTFLKGEDIFCARIIVTGAWMDTQKRKLTLPPGEAIIKMEGWPKAEDFQWLEQ